MVTMDSYEWADLIDDADKVRMLIDPTSTYARAAAAAMVAMDDAIIEAATGTAKTGKSGGTSTTMLSAHQLLTAQLTLHWRN